ncbi:MAG: hypothetical protein ACXAC2_07040 [Candidatus Kariarchaeaceae archaeon]|jgi:hypothetical protein
MKKELKNMRMLARVRILPTLDFKLFIIAILFISFTSAAVSSFFLGINPNEFFLGEENDVLVLRPSGTSTPMTGKIPTSLMYDVQKLEGVEMTSEEVLTIVVVQNLNERVMIVRGHQLILK